MKAAAEGRRRVNDKRVNEKVATVGGVAGGGGGGGGTDDRSPR